MTPFIAPSLHLLIDFWGAENLCDEVKIQKALHAAAQACGATVLDVRLHNFGEGSGITGVALLAESHISVHTWPEINYAALDVFMCGACDAEKTLPVLREYFKPREEKVTSFRRGQKD